MSVKPVTVDLLLRDIRAHCVDCMGGQKSMVAFCTSERCRLWPHRLPPDEAGRDYLIDRGGAELQGRQLSMTDMEAEACGP